MVGAGRKRESQLEPLRHWQGAKKVRTLQNRFARTVLPYGGACDGACKGSYERSEVRAEWQKEKAGVGGGGTSQVQASQARIQPSMQNQTRARKGRSGHQSQGVELVAGPLGLERTKAGAAVRARLEAGMVVGRNEVHVAGFDSIGVLVKVVASGH